MHRFLVDPYSAQRLANKSVMSFTLLFDIFDVRSNVGAACLLIWSLESAFFVLIRHRASDETDFTHSSLSEVGISHH